MAAPVYPKKPPKKPTVQMRQFHWTKLPDAKIKGTLWDTGRPDGESEGEVKEKELEQPELDALEQNFAAADKSKPTGGGGGGGIDAPAKKKDAVVTLLDPKTANNTAIALSKIKAAPEDVAAALLAGDDKVLTGDILQSLQGILPTPEDVELVQGWDGVGKLGKAEEFFLAIAQVPRYKIRTTCMLTRAHYTERAAELKMKVEDVAKAVEEVRGSKALKQILETTLAFGNYLNGGTNKGAAWGFKIDSLNKLIGTKTLDGKSTLLHYLARKLAKRNTVDQLLDELEHVENAARTVWKDVSAEFKSVETSLNQVGTQVKLDKNESFTASMGAFHQHAKADYEAITKMKKACDVEVEKLVKWFGEDAKVQAEEIFSAINNFSLTLEKGHRYNLDCDEKEAKKAKQEAHKKKMEQERAARRNTINQGGGPPGGGGGGGDDAGFKLKRRIPEPRPAGEEGGGGGGMPKADELQAFLAKRANKAGSGVVHEDRGGGVDSALEGMRNGIRVRQVKGQGNGDKKEKEKSKKKEKEAVKPVKFTVSNAKKPEASAPAPASAPVPAAQTLPAPGSAAAKKSMKRLQSGKGGGKEEYSSATEGSGSEPPEEKKKKKGFLGIRNPFKSKKK